MKLIKGYKKAHFSIKNFGGISGHNSKGRRISTYWGKKVKNLRYKRKNIKGAYKMKYLY